MLFQISLMYLRLPGWPYLVAGVDWEHSRKALGGARAVKTSTGSDVIMACHHA